MSTEEGPPLPLADGPDASEGLDASSAPSEQPMMASITPQEHQDTETTEVPSTATAPRLPLVPIQHLLNSQDDLAFAPPIDHAEGESRPHQTPTTTPLLPEQDPIEPQAQEPLAEANDLELEDPRPSAPSTPFLPQQPSQTTPSLPQEQAPTISSLATKQTSSEADAEDAISHRGTDPDPPSASPLLPVQHNDAESKPEDATNQAAQDGQELSHPPPATRPSLPGQPEASQAFERAMIAEAIREAHNRTVIDGSTLPMTPVRQPMSLPSHHHHHGPTGIVDSIAPLLINSSDCLVELVNADEGADTHTSSALIVQETAQGSDWSEDEHSYLSREMRSPNLFRSSSEQRIESPLSPTRDGDSYEEDSVRLTPGSLRRFQHANIQELSPIKLSPLQPIGRDVLQQSRIKAEEKEASPMTDMRRAKQKAIESDEEVANHLFRARVARKKIVVKKSGRRLPDVVVHGIVHYLVRSLAHPVSHLPSSASFDDTTRDKYTFLINLRQILPARLICKSFDLAISTGFSWTIAFSDWVGYRLPHQAGTSPLQVILNFLSRVCLPCVLHGEDHPEPVCSPLTPLPPTMRTSDFGEINVCRWHWQSVSDAVTSRIEIVCCHICLLEHRRGYASVAENEDGDLPVWIRNTCGSCRRERFVILNAELVDIPESFASNVDRTKAWKNYVLFGRGSAASAVHEARQDLTLQYEMSRSHCECGICQRQKRLREEELASARDSNRNRGANNGGGKNKRAKQSHD